jgi:hypothetical protein
MDSEIVYHAEGPDFGAVTWYPSKKLNDLLRTYPPDLQQTLNYQVHSYLEHAVRAAAANLLTGETAETLFKVIGEAMCEASTRIIEIIEKVAAGELPPCGHPECAGPNPILN